MESLTSFLVSFWNGMGSEQGKNRAASIQHIVISLGVVIGGIWAYTTYLQLQEQATADAGLRKTEIETKQLLDQAELSLLKLRQDTTQLSVVDAEISAEQTSIPGDDNRYVKATVTLHNTGSRPVLLTYKDHLIDPKTGKQAKVGDGNPERHPLVVVPVSFDGNGQPVFSLGTKSADGTDVLSSPKAKKLSILHVPVGNSAQIKTWQLLRPGQKDRIPFIVRVDHEGLHFVSFRVRIGQNSSEQEVYNKLAEDVRVDMPTASISASAFVIVK